MVAIRRIGRADLISLDKGSNCSRSAAHTVAATRTILANAPIAALCMIIAFPLAAQAKWKAAYSDASDEVAAWYSAQHNGIGQRCCDEADGHPFYGAYAVGKNGDVEFHFGGTHYHLPAYKVLHGPNPTGHAVWWYVDRFDGVHTDYCFALGSGG